MAVFLPDFLAGFAATGPFVPHQVPKFTDIDKVVTLDTVEDWLHANQMLTSWALVFSQEWT
eukprot:5476852-Pyramimonas_sp.AAC.1